MTLRRAAFLLALVVALPAAPAPRARAAEARSMEVRPVASPEAVSRGQMNGRPSRAVALRAGDRATLDARLARQRAFRSSEAALHARAYRAGATIRDNRRPGWVPPAARNSDAFARTGAAFETPPASDVDTVYLALLRIDFLADRGGSASSGTGRFNLDPADTLANPVDRPPHNRDFYRKHGEALTRYYDAQSYGRVHVVVDVWPAEQDSAYHLTDMADLGPWTFGSAIFEAAVKMMRSCFFAADSQSIAKGDRIPWDKYDRYMIIHAGSDLQSDLRQDSKEDIPSFTMFVDDTDRVVFPDSTTRPIDRVCFIPETINQDEAYGAINGVIAHENGHNLFGFGDVYDIETALPVCGYWTLMDSGNLLGAVVARAPGDTIFVVGILPPSIDPFQRNFILDQGLLTYRQPGAADTAAFALMGSQRHNDFVKLDLSSDEYVILENRYLSPASLVRLQQDDTTRVVLGPRDPDPFEYDALLPGGGVLAWHVDESVIPFTTSLRVNPDFGFNSNPRRLGLQILEADGLDDLGDVGSPFLLASNLDPWQASVAPTLSDDTSPSLKPNQGTRPHLRVDFLDDTRDTMLVRVTRTWQRAGWPVVGNFPPGGPALVAADLDRDGKPEVVWAGGDTTTTDTSLVVREATRDSSAVFAIRFDGKGLGGLDTLDFARTDNRPRREAAILPATPTSDGIVFVTTYWYGPSDTQGGRLWAFLPSGASVPNFPVTLPSPASTPPLVVPHPTFGWVVFVGCEDGRIRQVDATGNVGVPSVTVGGSGAVTGQLAFWQVNPPSVAGTLEGELAAGTGSGEVSVFHLPGLTLTHALTPLPGATRFAPDFLWLLMGGTGAEASSPCGGDPLTLVVHSGDRVWAYCHGDGTLLPGWGAALGDTLVAGMAAGDPDGDGFPEVIVQSRHSRLAWLNTTGRPSPGWSRPGSPELFETTSPPLALDLDGNGLPEIVALNASGMIAALDGRGRVPQGWPLATGAGAAGSMLAADLDADGVLDVVAPDRFGRIYAYVVPGSLTSPATSWTMAGGDPGRTYALSSARTSAPAAASPGPLVSGSFKAYPNPARREPVKFAYQLSEDATVEFRVLDTSGHEVTRFTRAGRRSDNLETWDPSGVPAGLYVVRVRFSGPRGARTESIPVGVLR